MVLKIIMAFKNIGQSLVIMFLIPVGVKCEEQ